MIKFTCFLMFSSSIYLFSCVLSSHDSLRSSPHFLYIDMQFYHVINWLSHLMFSRIIIFWLNVHASHLVSCAFLFHMTVMFIHMEFTCAISEHHVATCTIRFLSCELYTIFLQMIIHMYFLFNILSAKWLSQKFFFSSLFLNYHVWIKEVAWNGLIFQTCCSPWEDNVTGC